MLAFAAGAVCVIAQIVVLVVAGGAKADVAPLQAQPALVIPRSVGYFDYMVVDAKLRRLIAAHTESLSLAFIDVDKGTLVRQVYVGAAPHGLAIDERDGIYFAGTSGAAHAVMMIDRTTLKSAGSIAMPGPVDALAFDRTRGELYADEDDGDSIWVINARSRRIVATIHTPRDSDKVEYDARTDRVYQNFTTTNSMMIIDPACHAIATTWRTLPATRPHGLAVDPARRRVFVAGVNGRLAVIDLAAGRVIFSIDVAPHVDQIAFDPPRQRLYCASGEGQLSVVETGGRVRLLANVRVPRGAHTVAVDPVSGSVWISYGTEREDYVVRLVPR
jgi:DNA-binding beta-propeller fold protein YncE